MLAGITRADALAGTRKRQRIYTGLQEVSQILCFDKYLVLFIKVSLAGE